MNLTHHLIALHSQSCVHSLILAIVLLAGCGETPAHEGFPASELTFDAIFAQRAGDTNTVYCLLGSGFFRAPSSGHEDSLIVEWLAAHPRAQAVPVSRLQESPKSIIYIWLVDGKENLNTHLIAQGAFDGDVMMDHFDLKKLMDSIDSPLDDGAKIERFVADTLYDNFMKNVAAAEVWAMQQSFGIWKPGRKNIR